MDEVKREHEQHHEHVHEHVEHHKKSTTEKIRSNPWVLASIVLGVLALVLLISMLSSGNISANDAGKKLLNYYTGMGITNLSLSSITEVSGIYQVNLDYKGQIVPLYITKDGKNIITSLNPTETDSSSSNTQSATVPKSDKPTVELYVFTYCPYGTQMEKAIIPVVSLLGNKIDFKIRQIGAMHGDFEKIEAQRQLCIEKNYPTKFLDYVLAFDSDSSCSTGDAACL
ncbi:Uncharacterised protein [uncultured archaeon]|nr:Uncharacterised protein [uncultured archaeon]